jgi:probable rRNA maturation factor
LGYDAHEISIVITDNEGIKELNINYRGIDKPTNVLAFPMQEGDFTEITPGLLGDIVISVEKAATESLEAGIELNERISQLLVHGILHLIGFDHEQDENAAVKMEDKSIELLKLIEKNKDLKAF